MKSALRLVAIVGGQILAVLLLARMVRCRPEWVESVSVDFWAALAYGIPAVLAFLGCLRLVHLPPSSLLGRILSVALAVLVVGLGHAAGLFVLQRTDMWLTARYIQRMQGQLQADVRFKEVRLIGYSDDFILFPYIPVGGNVASEEDRRELERLLKASCPPAFTSAGRSSLVRKAATEQ